MHFSRVLANYSIFIVLILPKIGKERDKVKFSGTKQAQLRFILP